MAFDDYADHRADLRIVTSDAESRASGVSVGRINVWPPKSARGEDIVRLIEASRCDVVIVRMAAEDDELPAKLNTDLLLSWQADTLLYYEASARSLAHGHSAAKLEELSSGQESEGAALIGEIFKNYRNHYAANPILKKISVVAAYQDWMRTALKSGDHVVCRAVNHEGTTTGLCVLDTRSKHHDEVVLAGIIPAKRGLGAYQNMLRKVGSRAHGAGKKSVVISTQAPNFGAIRAWCRLGFVPTMALNTVHVVRRDTFHAFTAGKK